MLDVGDTGLSEHLATGIASCHAPGNPGGDDLGSPVATSAAIWPDVLRSGRRSSDVPGPRRALARPAVLATVTGLNHLFPFAAMSPPT